jgi:uncharacterized protein (TIGR03435 family)
MPLVAALLMAPLGVLALAQGVSADRPSPKFDVVSIKPCAGLPPGRGRGASPSAAQTSPGYVYWDCVSLEELINQAYTGPDTPLLNVLDEPREDSPKRVRGGPSWIGSERFTIEAKASGEAGVPSPFRVTKYLPAAMNLALRAMLDDRFQLKMHRATEQQPMYALTVAKTGLNKDKVTASTPGDCRTQARVTSADGQRLAPEIAKLPLCGGVHAGPRAAGIRRFEYTGFTLQELAENLSNIMDRFVLDKTGTGGTFNLAIEYAPNDNTPGDPFGAGGPDGARARAFFAAGGAPASSEPVTRPRGEGPTIFKALEALGLKLEQTKGPAEYLVIDRVERPRPNSPSAALLPPHRHRGLDLRRASRRDPAGADAH